jgi:hypothetical protein
MRPDDDDVERFNRAGTVQNPSGNESPLANADRAVRVRRGSLGETAVHAGVLGFLMGVPLIGHPPIDDDRFDIFHWGAHYAESPLRIVPDQFSLIGFYLTKYGNFRPVGRILERAQDTIVWIVSSSLGVPMHIVLRGFFAASMAIFAMAVVLLAGTLTQTGGSKSTRVNAATALVPVSLAALLIASGHDAPIVNFADLYLQTMALVLLICAYFARQPAIANRSSRTRAGRYVVWFLVGLLTASLNELALLALPMVVAVFGIRVFWIDRIRPREALESDRGRLLVSFVAGFSLVFVPIRYLVLLRCARDPCYWPTTLLIATDSPRVALGRATTWFPTQAWRTATAGSEDVWAIPTAPTVILIVLACWITARCFRAALNATLASRRARAGLTLLGVTLITLGAALGGSTAYLLAGQIESQAGWRDTIITMIGGSMVLAALTEASLRRGSRRGERFIAFLLLGIWSMAVALTLLANTAWTATMRTDAGFRPYVRMSLALTDPVPSDAENAMRCDILQPVLQEMAADPNQSYAFGRLEDALNTATRALIGEDFCHRQRAWSTEMGPS